MKILRHTLPSANALFVFDAAARHMSFSKAATELNVTQPAVSKMIGRLEQRLGGPLFLRQNRQLHLTPDGLLLAQALVNGLAPIEQAVDLIVSRNARKPAPTTVTLSLSSGFASMWLMPRLHRLQQACPHIELQFRVFNLEAHGGLGDADIGIRLHDPEDGIYDAVQLVPEEIIPVCSPGYLEEHGSLDAEDADGKHVFLHPSHPRVSWSAFLQTCRFQGLSSARDLTFPDYALLLQAAVCGQGVALGWLNSIVGAINAGLLVPACNQSLVTGPWYSVYVRQGQNTSAAVTLVRDWIVDEMQTDLHQFRVGN